MGDKGHGSNSKASWHLHDFSLVAGGSWGCHLQTLDVLGVNPMQGLQALAAKFIDHGRPCGDNTLG